MHKNERVGQPKSYKAIQPAKRKKITKIRGLYKLWLKANRYRLRLKAAKNNYIYVGTAHTLTSDKAKAIEFREGFDDYEVKRKYWQDKLGVQLIVERIL